jgi:hypothetical protein
MNNGTNNNGKKDYSKSHNTRRHGGGDVSQQKAAQERDKYMALAREAQIAGDRVTAEYYYQYADHYVRVMRAISDQIRRDSTSRNIGIEEKNEEQPV